MLLRIDFCFRQNFRSIQKAIKTLTQDIEVSEFNMKEAIVAKGPSVTIHDVEIPKPNADQVSYCFLQIILQADSR